MQRLCSSCLRGLKMGLAPSFPIEMEPVHFEPAEFFSSTGKRRMVDDEALVVRCPETSFQKIHEEIYKDIVTTRRQYFTPHDHLEHINFEQICLKYTNWTASNIAEFRLEFINHDEDEDALLDFKEVCCVLNNLGDDSATNVRFHCFVQTMTPELGNKVDFQDFLELCHMLCNVRGRDDINPGGGAETAPEASGAVGRTGSAAATPSERRKTEKRVTSPRTSARRAANATGAAAQRGVGGASGNDDPGCKPKPKTLCSCPLADISETETDARLFRGKSKVKSHDHMDNILRNNCVVKASTGFNKLGHPEMTGLELAENTRYSGSSDCNNRVT